MALLEACDTTPRKTRRNSMLILRAASQLNLASTDEGGDAVGYQSLSLLTGLGTDLNNSKGSGLHKVGSFQGIGGHEHVPIHGNGHDHHHDHRANTTSNKVAMERCVSALYGKLLMFIGIGFPIANVLSYDLPLIYYNSFYLYLYFGSILFLVFAYISLLSSFTMQCQNLVIYLKEICAYLKPFTASFYQHFSSSNKKASRQQSQSQKHGDEPAQNGKANFNSVDSIPASEMEEGHNNAHRSKFVYTENTGHGSMYLKMGTIVFGIGSMIYSGLEFGHYFELRKDCSDILMAITPAARMVFTFLQMYFIFLNSRVSISRHTTIARFGIMHMVATNLCIWVNVLVEETKHTIHHVSHLAHDDGDHGHTEHGDAHHNDTHHEPLLVTAVNNVFDYPTYDHDLFNDTASTFAMSTTLSPGASHIFGDSYDNNYGAHSIVKRASDDLDGCRIVNLMGNMVYSAAPLLYPCTIEYSLLCASVLYVMWNNVQGSKNSQSDSSSENNLSQFIARKVRHLYSVDCGRASRGLFAGIFVLVLTFITLILYYVLLSNDDFKYYGLLSARISEIFIYSVGIVTTIIGMLQLRKLGFVEEEETELDNVLLVVAQCGVYMFTIFTLIGGYFSKESMSAFTLIPALLMFIQATLTTLYILDGSRRCCDTPEQLERKHGREMVTFLLMLNLAMWLISTFQTSRADLHEPQQEFYGIWAWTIISHLSMPLGIFYRFHCTVCLGEIWKRAYKMRSEDHHH